MSCNASAELVQITNTGAAAMTLIDWTVRDRGPNFTLPLDNVTIAPGQTVTLQFGEGPDRAGTFRISDRNVWNNGGDTASIHAPNGDLVSSFDC